MSVRPPAYAVIVAGGSGSRMGATLPKQFLELCGKPVLYFSVKAFLDAQIGARIILVLPQQQMSLVQPVLEAFEGQASIITVPGGDTRYASVASGLKQVPSDAIVMVHDGARPLVTPGLIRRCYENACLHGSAVPVIPVADSIRQDSGYSSRAIARENLRIVQTPQAFAAATLHAAFKQAYVPSFTDEASVVEWSGGRVNLVEGSRSNLKITSPDDLVIAEALLKAR